MEKKEKLEKLKEELAELKKHNPSHCYGREGYVDHEMPFELFEKIEDLEDEIKKLQKEIND